MNTRRTNLWLAQLILVALPLYYLRFSVGPIPTNVIEVLVLALVIGTLISERRLSLHHWQPILLIIVGLSIATTVALDPQVALGIIKGWFVVPIAYFACLATLFAPNERIAVIKPALLGVILVAVYAILQWLGVIPLVAHQGPAAEQYLEQGRAIAFFESPNFLALYLVPLTLLTGGYFYVTKQYKQLAWLILPVIAIGLSQSLGGWLALAVGASWLWVASTGQPRRGFWLALLGVIIFVTVFIFTDNAARLMIWQNAWHLITTNGLLGIGPGQFQAHYALIGDGSALFASTLPYALHPHNIFLNFWLSAGLLGIVGFVWLLIQLFRRITITPVSLAALAGLAAVLIHGLVDSAYFKNDLAIIFWLLVFLARPMETIDHG